jgi:uncharacterized lipoprotein
MKSKKFVIISVISTTALLASVGIASAATNIGQSQLPQKAGTFHHMGFKAGRANFRGHMSSLMSVAAKDLNMTTQTLMTDLRSGKSINDLASLQGVDASKIETDIQNALTTGINQAEQAGKITSAQATKMESNLTKRVQNMLSQTHPAKGDRGPGFRAPMSSVMNVAAKDLNMTTQTLMTDLRSGKSINDLASVQGIDASKIETDVQNALTTGINQAEQAGKITTAQAAKMQSNLTKRVQNMLSRTWHGHIKKNESSQTTTTSNS